jgi:hypothetical protein
VFVFLVSCDIGGDSKYITAKAKLGNLAGAQVKVFRVLDNGSLSVHNTDITSDGENLEDIGNFLIKVDNVKDNDLFLIQVYGGMDWDADDDGFKDIQPTENKGVIRAFLTGRELKTLGNRINISLASELVFELLAGDFRYSFEKISFIEKLNLKAKEILKDDINGDGDIDNKDILLFDATFHKTALKEDISSNLNLLIEDVHKGNIPILKLGIYPVSFVSAGFSYKVKSKENLLFIGSPYGLYVYDISNLLNPVHLSSFKTYDWVWNFDLDNDVLIIAGLTDGFKVLDLRDPSNVSLLSEFYPVQKTDGAPDAQSVYIYSNTAITANGADGFSIYDLENPKNPVEVFTYKPCSNVKDAVLKGNTAYVICERGLRAFDIYSLQELFSFNVSKELSDIDIYKNKLAVSELEGTVYIFDISDPQAPVLSKTLKWQNDYIFSVSIKNNTLYVPLFYSGVEVWDISDAENPVKIGVLKVDGNVYSVSSDNSFIFAGTRGGVFIFDLGIFKSF